MYHITGLNIYTLNKALDKYSLKVGRTFKYEDGDISKEFEFSINSDNCIYFIDEFQIYQYNIIDDKLIEFMKFNFELSRKPEIFVLNSNQNICFIAAKTDILFVDIKE